MLLSVDDAASITHRRRMMYMQKPFARRRVSALSSLYHQLSCVSLPRLCAC
jgi:hypothetical protein